MTAALTVETTRPLATLNSVLAALRAESPAFGVTDGVVVDDPTGWLPATALVDGSALDRLLDGPARTWGAPPHAAAALAYKQYTYWLVMPAVLGWATSRRVPLCDAGNVLVRCDPDEMLVRVGLRAPRVAVRPDDPLAGTPGTVVVDDLLATLRDSLLDRHVTPLVAATRRRVRIGAHTLYGQLAASVAYVLAAAGGALLDPADDAAATVLSALGLADLAAVRAGEVRRSTCCLAFVVDGLGRQLCSDCCVPRG